MYKKISVTVILLFLIMTIPLINVDLSKHKQTITTKNMKPEYYDLLNYNYKNYFPYKLYNLNGQQHIKTINFNLWYFDLIKYNKTAFKNINESSFTFQGYGFNALPALDLFKPNTKYTIFATQTLIFKPDSSMLSNTAGIYLYKSSSDINIWLSHSSNLINIGDKITTHQRITTPSSLDNYNILFYSKNYQNGIRGIVQFDNLLIVEGHHSNFNYIPHFKEVNQAVEYVTYTTTDYIYVGNKIFYYIPELYNKFINLSINFLVELSLFIQNLIIIPIETTIKLLIQKLTDLLINIFKIF